MFFINTIRRTFSSNLQSVACSEKELSVLRDAKIENPAIQNYFAWRRSVMIFVLLCTALSACLSTLHLIDEADQKPEIVPTIEEHLAENFGLDIFSHSGNSVLSGAPDDVSDEEFRTVFGMVSETIQVLSWYMLPLTALLAVMLFTKFRITHYAIVIAFGFSFLFPMLIALCPWGWSYALPPDASASIAEKKAETFAYGLAYGAEYLITLLPSVLSLVPGAQRSCLRVKTLLPHSVLPGWLLVVAAPFYSLVLLVIFVAVNQVASGPLFFVGMSLLLLAPLAYPIWMEVFTRPLTSVDDYRKLGLIRAFVGATNCVAGISLLIFLASLDFQGVHVFGLDRKTSLLQPLDIVQLILETVGKSLFVTVLGSDILMRFNQIAWKYSDCFLGSTDAESYGATMKQMGQL